MFNVLLFNILKEMEDVLCFMFYARTKSLISLVIYYLLSTYLPEIRAIKEQNLQNLENYS